ncbi:putative lipoprotein [Mycobacterium kansasii]|uniref:Putative lipoprotein n=1 Tax=Mycobacterium kansasii TaxID=1768 RepID=A0A1V3WY87_MYCKA|nr:putative lipoprotein [Mycobacterium kansasii]
MLAAIGRPIALTRLAGSPWAACDLAGKSAARNAPLARRATGNAPRPAGCSAPMSRTVSSPGSPSSEQLRRSGFGYRDDG